MLSPFLLTLFFVLTCFSVFNAAYPSGDDVVHLVEVMRHDVYAPIFGPAWTPNRVVDIYGRTLFTATFDFFFFPLNLLTGISFYLFNKIFSALCFSAFLTGVYGYFLKKFNGSRGFDMASIDALFIKLFIGSALLVMFPWKNQIYFISYQIPAFLTFLLTTQLWIALCPIKGLERSDINIGSSALIFTSFVLPYVCAFSIESNSLYLMLLVAIMFGMSVLIHFKDLYSVSLIKKFLCERLNFIATASVTVVFSLLSLALSFLYSGRTQHFHDVVENKKWRFNVLAGFESGLLSNSNDSRYVINTLLLLLFLSLVYFIRGSLCKLSQWREGALGQTGNYVLFSLSSLIAIVISTVLVSHSTQLDYFRMDIYPWGVLILPAKLSLFFLLIFILSQPRLAPWLVPSYAGILLFIFMSQNVVEFLKISQVNFSDSQAVGLAYQQIADNKTEIHLPSQLNRFQIEIRPLPGTGTPQWFNEEYNMLFKKYLFKNAEINFQ